MKKIACDHCQLEFGEDVMIKEQGDDQLLHFCCKGCQGVFHLLQSEGLESFYDKVGETKLDPASGILEDLEKFDHEGFAKKYIRDKEGLSEINLIIEGIHCSACVWLNEKILHKTDGIIEADINYTNHKAKVLWDPTLIKLSEIIQKVQSIGYNAYPYDARAQEERANKARKDYYARLLVGVFATMNIMWLAIAQYTGYFTGIRDDMKNVLNIAEFILATPVLFYTGWVYFKGAYYGLKNRFINMDFLVATGASLAYLYSIYVMITGVGEVYFDSVVMIITFIFVGKYLEVLSKKRAVDTLDTMTSSIPTEVVVIKGNEKEVVSIEAIEVGDIIEIKPGEKIVIDGQVLSGESSVDESSLTGESEPIYKKADDMLMSGGVNLDGVLRYKATKAFNTSMLSTIVTLLEDSLTKKPKIEKLANEISGHFSLVILILAIGTFIGWYIVDGSFEKALIISISVIVIACPCALGLATPVATLIGLGVGAKRGLLFKEASYLESMAKSDVLLLDKTGTITEGKPKVVEQRLHSDFDINLLYALVKSSGHPISRGIALFLEQNHQDLQEYTLQDAKNIEARGIEACYQHQRLFGGNVRLLQERGIDFEIESENSIFAFVIDDQLVATYMLRDSAKSDAKESIAYFQKMGFEVAMLTGDNEKVANAIAKEVGINRVYHSLYPKDKADIVDNYHNKNHVVIMAGDGINDAIALSKSDIAIAMGSGADISVEVSDLVLLDDQMKSLAEALKLSRQTFKNIKQNLTMSLVYNIFTVPLAIAGYVIPLVAALSMSLSSLLVVANAVRIKRGFKE
ncbi:MAG: cadmium-translocating P-type ATPase [Epsilonproteobacteria bacterium]|nr:cadmium-translocating P-type ATPase [Campylobacterota bacterium]